MLVRQSIELGTEAGRQPVDFFVPRTQGIHLLHQEFDLLGVLVLLVRYFVLFMLLSDLFRLQESCFLCLERMNERLQLSLLLVELL
jgi:hypothetical protein